MDGKRGKWEGKWGGKGRKNVKEINKIKKGGKKRERNAKQRQQWRTMKKEIKGNEIITRNQNLDFFSHFYIDIILFKD